MSLPLHQGRFAGFPHASILNNRAPTEPRALKDLAAIRQTLMNSRPRPSQMGRQIRCYGLAVLFLVAAVLGRILLDKLIPNQLPFVTYFPAVLITSYYCGLGPAILVLLVSSLIGTFWVLPAGIDPVLYYTLTFMLFMLVAGLNVALIHVLTSALHQLRQRDEQLAVINRELKHRIKNLFSIASSIALRTIKSGRSPEEMSQAVIGRIMAIAAAQDLLSVEAAHGTDIKELVGAVVTTLAPEPGRLAASGPSVMLSAQVTTPFALILHELGTNAVKYGAWSQDSGCVRVSWELEKDQLNVTWLEQDGPSIAPTPREGLGRALITNSLPGAAVTHDLKADGLECLIRLPLEP